MSRIRHQNSVNQTWDLKELLRSWIFCTHKKHKSPEYNSNPLASARCDPATNEVCACWASDREVLAALADYESFQSMIATKVRRQVAWDVRLANASRAYAQWKTCVHNEDTRSWMQNALLPRRYEMKHRADEKLTAVSGQHSVQQKKPSEFDSDGGRFRTQSRHRESEFSTKMVCFHVNATISSHEYCSSRILIGFLFWLRSPGCLRRA